MNLSKALMFWKPRHVSKGIVIGLFIGMVALGQTMLDIPIKQGLWQTTVTTTMVVTLPAAEEAQLAAMPPAQQAMVRAQMGGKPMVNTFKSCAAKQESVNNLLSDAQQQSGVKCTYTNRTQTASGTSFDTACVSQDGTLNGHTDIQVVGDGHVTAASHLTGQGTGSNGPAMSYTADSKIDWKYLGADCGTVKPNTSE